MLFVVGAYQTLFLNSEKDRERVGPRDGTRFHFTDFPLRPNTIQPGQPHRRLVPGRLGVQFGHQPMRAGCRPVCVSLFCDGCGQPIIHRPSALRRSSSEAPTLDGVSHRRPKTWALR